MAFPDALRCLPRVTRGRHLNRSGKARKRTPTSRAGAFGADIAPWHPNSPAIGLLGPTLLPGRKTAPPQATIGQPFWAAPQGSPRPKPGPLPPPAEHFFGVPAKPKARRMGFLKPFVIPGESSSSLLRLYWLHPARSLMELSPGMGLSDLTSKRAFADAPGRNRPSWKILSEPRNCNFQNAEGSPFAEVTTRQ